MQQPGANPGAGISGISFSARFLVYLGFALTGVVTTLLGPILPWLAARWSLTDAQAGLFFSAQFLGSMAGVAAMSLLIPRRGFSSSLLVGFVLMAAGVCTLGLGSWALGLITVFGYGLGLGVTIPTANLWVAGAPRERRAAALSLLNFAWGLGAVACPLLFAALKPSIGERAFVVGLAVALGILSISLACVEPAGATKALGKIVSLEAGRWHAHAVLKLAVLFFLYVGTENGLGGWVAYYARRMNADPGSGWVLTPSFFWGALLLGRALAPVELRAVTEAQAVGAGLLLAIGGTLTLLYAGTVAGVMAGAAIAGLGLAPIFPILVAWLSEQFGAAAPRAGSALFALGSLGGATLPWIVGLTSARFGTLRAGLVIPLAASLLMLALEYGSFGRGNCESLPAGEAGPGPRAPQMSK